MQSFLSYLLESLDKDYNDTISALDNINITGRKPKGVSVKSMSFLKAAKRLVDMYALDTTLPPHIAAITQEKISDATKKEVIRYLKDIPSDEMEIINTKLGSSEDKPNTIKKGSVTFIKKDSSSYETFIKVIDELDKFLSKLTGIHEKSAKNLTINFVGTSEMKAKAKYLTNKDEINMRLYKGMPFDDSYGSPKYVLLHELGHRYLKKHKQNFDINAPEWVTTKYSKVDSWNEEEKFAELYALSYWVKKYKKEYGDVISKWLKLVK